MTLTTFVTKSAFRNKRRSALTMLSIAFSLMLLTFMMTVWRGVLPGRGQRTVDPEADHPPPRVADVLDAGHYREKIRTVPGVVAVVPTQLVRGEIPRRQTGALFRPVRNRSARVFQGLHRFQDSRGPVERVAARSHRGRGGQRAA